MWGQLYKNNFLTKTNFFKLPEPGVGVGGKEINI